MIELAICLVAVASILNSISIGFLLLMEAQRR